MFGLITDANFFVVLIALLIISFLLGLIIGMLLSKRDYRQVSTNRQNATSVSSDNPQAADSAEQNIKPEARQNSSQDGSTVKGQEQKLKDLRYKYFYYW